MGKDLSNPSRALVEAVRILRNCRPLAERMDIHGITVELSQEEKTALLDFEQVVLAGYSESEWSYLRVASGVNLRGVAVLTRCLSRFKTEADDKPVLDIEG